MCPEYRVTYLSGRTTPIKSMTYEVRCFACVSKLLLCSALLVPRPQLDDVRNCHCWTFRCFRPAFSPTPSPLRSADTGSWQQSRHTDCAQHTCSCCSACCPLPSVRCLS